MRILLLLKNSEITPLFPATICRTQKKCHPVIQDRQSISPLGKKFFILTFPMGQGSGRLSDNDKLNVRATCPKGRLESTVVLSYKSMVLHVTIILSINWLHFFRSL